MNIKDFMLARITEDEAAVGKPVTDLPVTRVHHPHTIKDVPGHLGATVEIPAHDQLAVRPVVATWTADPARVLTECAAKRAIIEAHPIVDDVVEVSTRIKWGFACETCFSYGDIVEDNGYCDTLRALASVYADHPDYQSDWAL